MSSVEQTSPRGAFHPSEALRRQAEPLSPGELNPQDAAELSLLLRGESVVDWHRMALETSAQARRLFALNGIDVDDPVDLERVEALRAQAVSYLVEALGLRLDAEIAKDLPALELPLVASGRGKRQRNACTLLKVMHILHHLDARELSTVLSIPSTELFSLVEESVVRMFDVLQAAGVPVVEFAWSRKTRESLITKLLVKKQTSAARIFDRLRFRLIVDRREDLVPALQVMLHRCIPFNYVVPGETVNTLIDPADLRKRTRAGELTRFGSGSFERMDDRGVNEFSSKDYRVLNFVADLPVRIDSILDAADDPELRVRGRVVFVLAEFQILDRETAARNEEGDTSHAAYKVRQHQRVRERLLRGPKQS